ncbi:MAG: 6-carboxytetrahydropterin synthase QueD [Verrucomicrobiales bacterium]
MFTVTKEFRFEAAHSLPLLPEGHKCRQIHGHSYRFRVEVDGELDERGFVIEYADITTVAEPVVRYLDHQNLNELFDFPTSTENLAKWIYDKLSEKIPVARIVLYETANTSVIYPARRG